VRVLVVDANATSRHALERTLQSAGCAVRCAASGPEVELLLTRATEQGERFDTALIDLSVPAELLAQGPPIPTVGLRSIRGAGTAAQLGGEYALFLRKPIEEHQLLDAIASLLRTADAAPSTAA